MYLNSILLILLIFFQELFWLEKHAINTVAFKIKLCDRLKETPLVCVLNSSNLAVFSSSSTLVSYVQGMSVVLTAKLMP